MPIMSLIECIRELPLRGPRGNVIAVCHEREENPAEIARNEFNLGDSEITLRGTRRSVSWNRSTTGIRVEAGDEEHSVD